MEHPCHFDPTQACHGEHLCLELDEEKDSSFEKFDHLHALQALA
jgi:hypothetical protein